MRTTIRNIINKNGAPIKKKSPAAAAPIPKTPNNKENGLSSKIRNTLFNIINHGSSHEKSINLILSSLAKMTGANHSYIFERHIGAGGENLVSIRHEWAAPNHKAELSNPLFQNMPYNSAGFRKWTEALEKGEFIVAATAESDAKIKNIFKNSETASLLIIPILIDGLLIGILGFESDHEKKWDPDDIAAAKTCCVYLGGVIKRVRLEKALAESEERLNFALDGSGDGVWDWNIANNEVHYSYKYKEILGFKNGTGFANDISEWVKRIHPAHKKELYKKLQQYIGGRDRSGRHVFEYRIEKMDGSYIWVRDRARAVSWNEDGSPARIVGTITDITEEIKQKEALISCNKILEIINGIENRRQGIKKILAELGAATGSDSVYIFEKKSAGGKDRISITYEWTARGINPSINNPLLKDMDYKKHGFAGWERTLRKGNIIQGGPKDFPGNERAFLEKIGNMSTLIVPIFVAGEPWGFIGFKSVSTEKRWPAYEIEVLKTAAAMLGMTMKRAEAEEALLMSEKKYRQVVELSHEGFILSDEQDKIIFTNRRVLEILGFTESELAGKNILKLMDKKSAEIFKTSSPARKINQPLVFISKDARAIHTNASFAKTGDGENRMNGRLTILTDETEHIKMQARIEQTKKEVFEKYSFDDIIGKSKPMLEIFDIIPIMAGSGSNLLIEGPSGTGKNMIAKAVHNRSLRKNGPFVVINCGAIPETLLESELFGYVKGAFTDAGRDKPGRFAIACGGTIFLDEIGEMPMSVQVKLLRVIEEKIYEPLGSSRPIKADVRVIAATNKNLAELVRRGEFREDLYYRLKIIHVKIPHLRDRREDIDILAEKFVEILNKKHAREMTGISDAVREFFNIYEFPGNVRELQNILEHAYIFCRGRTIEMEHLSPEYRTLSNFSGMRNASGFSEVNGNSTAVLPLAHANSNPRAEAKRRELIRALEICSSNRSKAAGLLKISRMALWRRMKKFGLE